MPKPFRLNRRTFLAGAGTLVALPWLEAMESKDARANAQTSPVRFITFYIPIGVCRSGWNPTGTETNWSLGSTVDPSDPLLYGMSPLAAYQQDINVITGVSNTKNDGAHVASQACVLTANNITPSTTSQDMSADQYVADYWEATSATNLRSLELGTFILTNYPDGYDPGITDHMSWLHGTPLAKEIDPQKAFDRVFAGVDPTATAAANAKRKAYGQSVIDTVRTQANRLQSRVGAADKAKLDEYITGVRELELRLSTSANQGCNIGSRPNAPPDMPTLVQQMLDITVLAVQCDITRVVTFAYECTVTETSHPFAGVNTGYHIGVTHCGQTGLCDASGTSYETLYIRVNRWLVSQYAYLIGKMKGIQEGSGTLLDNSFVYLTSEFGDGSLHSGNNLPQIIAGSGGGKVKTGRLLDRTGQQNGNVMLAMMQNIGLKQNQLGVCQGAISL